MTEDECLSRMVAPGTRRPGKFRNGVIQIHVTRACDKSCFACTQGSNLAGKPTFITVDQFEQALQSLAGYWGVVGIFGGNPATHPQFTSLCELVRKYFPREQCGLWCNNPITEDKAHEMRLTFNPAVSNLNVHLDRKAYDMFRTCWPECKPFGLHEDSRHSPPFVAMKDLDVLPAHPGRDVKIITKMPNTEENRHTLIADCDINKHWSALIGVFRGQLRAWFCEIAGAQAMLHQDEPDYPDTGLIIDPGSRYFPGAYKGESWWQESMITFAPQVRKHCHECGVPLRGYGELAQSTHGHEQVSSTHANVYRPKRVGRQVELVTKLEQLGIGRLQRMTEYLQNSHK